MINYKLKSKNVFWHTIIVFNLCLLYSCKKSTVTAYDNNTNYLYFKSISTIDADSINIKFAYLDNTLSDSIIQLVVTATGTKSEKDRPYTLKVIDSLTTAINGQDFVMPPDDSLVIKANQMTDTVNIKIMNSARLTDTMALLTIKLMNNDNFLTDITLPTGVNSGINYDGSIFRIKFDNIYIMPSYWDYYSYYFGTFSKKKFNFILNLYGLTADILGLYLADEDEDGIANAEQIASSVQSFLDYYNNLGQTVYEDDGTPMTMGDYTK